MILGRIYCSEIKVLEWRKECDFNISNNIDVWRIYIPDFLDSIENNIHLLSEEEFERSMSFIQEADKNRFIIGKIFLKKLVANYLNIDPTEIVFNKLEFNKPELESYSDFKFNISHSGDFIIFGFANRWSLGVDIEFMDTKIDLYNLIYNTMSSVEISSILNSGFPREMFFKYWTRKEALLKGIGVGVTDRLKDISACDGRNLIPSDLSSFASSWEIRNFLINDSYSVSIAFDAAIRIMRFFEFQKI